MPKKTTLAAPVTLEGMTVNGVTLYLDDGGKELEKTCPKCNKRKPISEFGLRQLTARNEQHVIRLQPWCSSCR